MPNKLKYKPMKFKVLYLLAIIGLMSFTSHAQRGVRIGYIDTEFILQNVPEYQEASTQLDTKIAQWKSEVDKRLGEIDLKKKALDNEKVLLTKELYEERFEDISFEESEILDYQQKRFGPNGDMIIQRTQLIQPIQDQIYAAVKEIAETRKYDFIFDKNADFLMLYSAERYDVSEQVLRIITRTSKREQAKTKKERKALEEEEYVPEEVDAEKDERAKALEDKKALRTKQIEDKRLEREKGLEERRQKQKADREAKKKATDERRQKAIDARKKKEPETKKVKDSIATNSEKSKTIVKTDSTKVKTAKQLQDEKRQKAIKDREDRKKALDARKKKLADDRKKAREARVLQIKKNDSIRKAKANNKN
jgi:Skp family chaperone for outer membrane proteins